MGGSSENGLKEKTKVQKLAEIDNEIEKLKRKREEILKSGTSSSDDEEMHSQHPSTFLVRSLNSNSDNTPPSPGRRIYRQMDFHLINLDKKEIHLDISRPMHNCNGNGAMVMLDLDLYVLGGVFDIDVFNLKNEDNDPKFYHKGASRLNVFLDSWKHLPAPVNRVMSNPVVMCGKIYCFGLPWLHLEVYTTQQAPAAGYWKDLVLPPTLRVNENGTRRSVSFPVVPDPSNRRILVHLCDTNQLYAFYPPLENQDQGKRAHGKWQLIVPRLYFWYDAVAVADNILYYHYWNFPDVVRAYDLKTKMPLNVVADLSSLDGYVCHYDAIFTLPGKGFMCLTSKLPAATRHELPSLVFLRFRVKRISSRELKITALDYQSYPIPSAATVCDFV